MKNLKLFVDDFRDAPDDTWNVARTTEEAIRAIATMEFSEISLDHDIENRPETFQPVAYFIGVKYYTDMPVDIEVGGKIHKMRPLLGPKIFIHSGNPVGAQNMVDILQSYGITSILTPIFRWERT